MMFNGIKELVFESCNFIKNEAHQNKSMSGPIQNSDTNPYYNGDGGAIQIGCQTETAEKKLRFKNCIFNENKAARHGGALAIQTIKELAKLLINHPNIDINAIEISTDWKFTNSKTNALLSAVWMDNHKLVELLLKQKNIKINMILPEIKYQQDDCDIIEQNALIETINIGDIDMINLFLTNDQTDINVQCLSYDGISFAVFDTERPIFSAIKNGFTNIVKLLLSHPKIDLNSRIVYMKDKKLNDSVLGYAIRQGEIEITKLLLEQPQIDVNSICKNTDGFSCLYEEKTPLYIAVENEKEEIVKLLLSHSKIDVNCQLLQRDNLNSSIN